MVEEQKEVIVSKSYKDHLNLIIEYSNEIFGYNQSEKYLNIIIYLVERLYYNYGMYPECCHLATKKRIYRNIILDSHLIIYMITVLRIEVLDIIHSASSIRKIRGIRSIRIPK
ncbi:MAG: type II toxin-antitoxin system RelE/ParE family toxin [Prevotellaceae bacterium]|jgi:plasmid stabilization system protein ParE|nr:type II toxin-antitoxin system RelE/ParE family toxin [Prevotellaceae bacterium]